MAFAALRQAGEAQIIQMYALKLCAATVCLAPQAVAAAVLALCNEREAALVAFREIMRSAERDQRQRVSAALRNERAPNHGRPSLAWSSSAEQFAQAGRVLCRRRRSAVHIRRNWQRAVRQCFLAPG